MKLKTYNLEKLLAKVIIVFTLITVCSCDFKVKEASKEVISTVPILKVEPHTKYSELENEYLNFNSPKAINHIAKIENNYFKDYEQGYSNYYGTVWRDLAEKRMINDSLSYYDFYKTQLKVKPDSLHCTLYAYEGLKAGFNSERLDKITKLHKKIWRKREIAGWSIGYILVKHFNWKAYHIISENAEQFKYYNKIFLRSKTYPVWKQPAIPVEEQLIIEKDTEKITELLENNEFGWGFSDQGIHTWITRFAVLKECNWSGAPSSKVDIYKIKPLFINTPFLRYFDYNSHIVIYPPKQKDTIN